MNRNSQLKRTGFAAKANWSKAPRKPMRAKSKKRVAQHASPEGQADLEHMGCVKMQDCRSCGAQGPNDAHHCKCKPPKALWNLYEKLPFGCKSGAKDTISLCPWCHTDGPESYHRNRPAFIAKNGHDYTHIKATRAAVKSMLGEIDF